MSANFEAKNEGKWKQQAEKNKEKIPKDARSSRQFTALKKGTIKQTRNPHQRRKKHNPVRPVISARLAFSSVSTLQYFCLSAPFVAGQGLGPDGSMYGLYDDVVDIQSNF